MVEIDPVSPERYAEVLETVAARVLVEAEAGARRICEGRVVWNVNSTAVGGGVAELLRSLLAYARGAGVDARWAVITGSPEFFELTKRIHNQLHDFAGGGGTLGAAERAEYEGALEPNARELTVM